VSTERRGEERRFVVGKEEEQDRAEEMTAESNGYLGRLPTLSGLQVADPGMADGWPDMKCQWHIPGVCRKSASRMCSSFCSAARHRTLVSILPYTLLALRKLTSLSCIVVW
jgi:hypothetical protein